MHEWWWWDWMVHYLLGVCRIMFIIGESRRFHNTHIISCRPCLFIIWTPALPFSRVKSKRCSLCRNVFHLSCTLSGSSEDAAKRRCAVWEIKAQAWKREGANLAQTGQLTVHGHWCCWMDVAPDVNKNGEASGSNMPRYLCLTSQHFMPTSGFL